MKYYLKKINSILDSAMDKKKKIKYIMKYIIFKDNEGLLNISIGIDDKKHI